MCAPPKSQTLAMKHREKSFKNEFSFEERLAESKDIIAKYPDRVPICKGLIKVFQHWLLVYAAGGLVPELRGRSRVIVERFSRSDLPDMEKRKYLVPRDMSVGQFIHVLSSRLYLSPGKALFVFVQNTLPQTATLLDSLYDSYKDEDGFLYMCYSSEKTFG